MEHRSRIQDRLSQCLTDRRGPNRIEHSVEALIMKRVRELRLGYEDFNDQDKLRRDRLMALLCDWDDLMGEFQPLRSDRGMKRPHAPCHSS